MKKSWIIWVISVLVLLAIVLIISFAFKSDKEIKSEEDFYLGEMKIKSVFENNGTIPEKYSCDGDDVNPFFEISNVPSATKSLVLIMDDPDAPAGVWTHWVVFNIAPSINKILEDSVPAGALQGINSFGKKDYGGPCPPSGTHRYYFKLYALDIMLNLENGASKSQIEKAMQGHIIGKAELMGRYSRD